MPIYKYVNADFFKKWSFDMAYVLGFFTADGNMIRNKRGAYFIEFTSTDKDIIYKIHKVMRSDHKISSRQRTEKTEYRFQLGSKNMFKDLIKLGLTPNKSKTIKLPSIPIKYLPDFVRGYFDGDGNVTFGYFKRKGKVRHSPIIMVRFTSGSKDFIYQLKNKLSSIIKVCGCISHSSGAYRLSYAKHESYKLFAFMYRNNYEGLIYLNRKYRIFKNAGVA